MGRRAPRRLTNALAAAMGRAAPQTPLAAVQSAWPEAVGPAIAAEATPVSERDGVVTVACRSATWAHELDLMGDRITAQLRDRLPEGTPLEGFRFTATGN